MSSLRRDRTALLLALAIAAATFAISFGFSADADRGAPTAAAHRVPRHEPASPHVALGPAPSLHVRASLLTPPARPARRRRVQRRVAPAPAADASVPSAVPDGSTAPDASAPANAAPPTQPSAPSAPVDVTPPAPTPSPRPAPKPRPKPAAKPKPPKPPDFDDEGPPAPGKSRSVGR